MQQHQLDNPQHQLDKLAPFATWHCSKTGQFIGQFTELQLAEIHACHGFERSRDMLRISQLGHIHPLWLATDSTALSRLIHKDSIGYFIYAASLLLHPCSFNAGETLAPSVHYAPALAPSAQTEQLVESFTGIESTYRILQDKKSGHELLSASLRDLPTETLNLLDQLNSTLANLYAIKRPELIQQTIRKLHSFNLLPLAHWAASLTTLRELLGHLQAFASRLGQHMANLQREPFIQKYIAKSVLLAEIDKGHGLAAFRGQRKPKACNLDDEIMTQLRDFFCDSTFGAELLPSAKQAQQAKPTNPVPPLSPITPVQLATFAACLQSAPKAQSLAEIFAREASTACEGSKQ
jgi:hypothetical protein